MPFIDDILRGLQIQIDAFWYNILLTGAGLHWDLLRAVFVAGYTIELVNHWLAQAAFAPLIGQTAAGLQTAFTLIFVVAMFVLGVTYSLASLVRLNVVEPRSAILWYLAGALFFGAGPSLYTGMNAVRRDIASVLYLSTLNGLQTSSGGAFTSLNNVSSGGVGVLAPCDSFAPYLSNSGGVDGLDIALAYLRADGVDVMGYGATCGVHYTTNSGAIISSIPTEWYRPGSFFDNTIQAILYPILTDEQRAESIRLASSAHGRLLTVWPLVLFGLAEQTVDLLLTVAQGLTFISFGIAVLFAFFKRTEVIARSVLDQWVELIIQTVMIAVIQALVVAFFLAGATTGSGVVVLGVGVICLIFMLIVLWSGVKAVWNSFNRLFAAVGQVTGGAVISPGRVATIAGAGVAAAATGGATLAAGVAGAGISALAGLSALNQGATLSQAAGLSLGGSQPLSGAARTLAYLPGVRGTSLGDAAEQFAEGAVTRTVARRIPGVGHVAGPIVGATLLTDRDPDHADYDETGRVIARPMLVPAVGKGLERFTTPGGARKQNPPTQQDYLEDENGEMLPLNSARPQRLGVFTPDAPVDRAEYGAGMRGEEMERHLTETMQSATGQLRVSGETAVASVMADVLRLVVGNGQSTKALDHLAIGEHIAAAVGVTSPDGNQSPLTTDLARFSLFLNQALRLGLSPAGAERIVREVKGSSDGFLAADSRHDLTKSIRQTHDLPWSDARREVRSLERGATLLPDAIIVQGAVNLPNLTVNPQVNLTVKTPDTGTNQAYEQAAQREAALSGSQPLTKGQA